MKLIKTNQDNWVRTIDGHGLFMAKHSGKVTELSGEFNYTGPKIPPDVWRQILSFFKWTYDTTQSESQVRLFVSVKLNTWKAWAFPQQAECGLSTKELPTEDARKQRAELFENHDDWTAWGTVHHHCGISAFQSGTDESDEKNVGGLHITVGDLDKPHHSIHCRLYHQGDLYEPDMGKFWDIGNLVETLPVEIRALLPADCGDRLAREQMCLPSAIEFPEAWKNNLIKVEHKSYADSWFSRDSKPEPEKDGDIQWIGDTCYHRQNGVWQASPFPTNNQPVTRRRARGASGLDPLGVRAADALDELLHNTSMYNIEETDVQSELYDMTKDDLYGLILQVCKDYSVNPDDLMDEFQRRQEALNKPEQPSTEQETV